MDNLSCKALPSRRPRKNHNEISLSASINQSINSSLQLNFSLADLASALPNCNLSIPSSQTSNKTPTPSPSRLKCNRTPHQSFSQSCKSIHRTGGKNVKTPLGPDRFIPDRSAINLDVSHYLLTNNHDQENDEVQRLNDPDLRRRRALSDLLNGDLSSYRMMPCKENRPAKETYLSAKKSVTKKQRVIPSQSEKVLDAPDVKNDFYLQLLDWSDTNVLAVALDREVYLWNAVSGEITNLLTLPGSDYIASLSWIQGGNTLAVGTGDGSPNAVELWDCTKKKRIRAMHSHESRASSLSWNSWVLSSGDRQGQIHNHDVRVADHLIGKYLLHSQDICGLRWSPNNGDYLASGSNDNIVHIWPNSPAGESTQPVHSFKKHKAAVKAMAWCPWKPSLLATGGGARDRSIHVWNVNTHESIASVETPSQVCSLLWSKQYHELISGHGHSDNQLTIWQFPGLTKMADLYGHSARILGMSMSPDGQTVVSLGADETLRFWECFQEDKDLKKKKEICTKENIIANPIRMMSIR